MEYDLIIIGMGISGISAAIYAKNSGMNVLMLEKSTPGGLLNKISTINNYPGFASITGANLSYHLFESILKLKIPFKNCEVTQIKVENELKIIETTNGVFKTKYVIIATGRSNRKLGLEKEEELIGHGVSTCALCDGNLYKDQEIAVVGGGNSAIEEALYLASLASKVYLIHRRNTFRAEENLVRKLKEKKNVEFLYNSEVTTLQEEGSFLKGILINQEKELPVKALFLCIGFEPKNDFIKDLEIVNEEGYIEVNQNYETRVLGIFAVGDCIKKDIYQLITAANDGVIASINIRKKLDK